ncbi:hypothetical protein P3T76_014380 [Phytophthora citrophthora]|uniref:M96 mating-specific protein family n=1 Tax=Phytophthora citrophthora TaxID=4793 RepID=A0AAD9G2A6_9STRA|nr:hypothetical protein P3T76_014380 [Phytophthora citrophthora]
MSIPDYNPRAIYTYTRTRFVDLTNVAFEWINVWIIMMAVIGDANKANATIKTIIARMDEFEVTLDFLDVFVADDLFGGLEEPPIKPQSSTSKQHRRPTPKQQIERFQREIRQLTAQLQSLEAKRPRRSSNAKDAKIWRDVAVRQLERRQNSESENTNLREMVKLQIEEAKNLKRILHRRTKIQRLQNMLISDQEQEATAESLTVFDQETEQVFGRMLHDIDELYNKVDANFEEKGMSSIPCPGRKRYTDSTMLNGVCFELTQREEVPFSVDMVKDAVWDSLGQLELEGLRSAGSLKANVPFRKQESEGNTNTVMTSFVAVNRNKNVSGIKVRKIVRRYDEDSRTVFIYRTVMEPKIHSLDEPIGVLATSTLLISIQNCDPSGKSTLIQSHFSAARYDEGLAAGYRLRLDVNLKAAIAVWDESIQRIHDQVENRLVDTMLEKQHSVTGDAASPFI